MGYWRNKILFGLLLVVFVAAAVLIILFRTQKAPIARVQNFQECLTEGYPVMQSYPRQCTLPNGKIFVEQVVPGR